MKLPLAALALCYAIFFTCLTATTRELPLRLATHFDIAGSPNGWMGRAFYLEFTIGLATLLPAFLIAMTSFLAELPGSLRRIPHREYWMAPERYAGTIAVMRRFMAGFCSLLVLFLTGVHLLLVEANFHSAQPHLNAIGIWSLAGMFLIGTLLWVWTLRRHFAHLP